MAGTRGKRTKRLLAVAATLLGIAIAAPGTIIPAGATATIAHLVFNPSPIGHSSNTAPGHVVTVVLTAQDSTRAPIPHATVYLSFKQAIGGGTAFVGTSVLAVKQRAFVTDASGTIQITYTTPRTFPRTGVDILHAQNGSTSATSTIKLGDTFCYSNITVIAFTPKPIAKHAGLRPHASVPLTLTVFKSGGVPAAGSTVYLRMEQAIGGGTALVGTTALSETSRGFVVDSNGQVHIIYTTATTLPSAGTDSIDAGNETTLSCASAHDSYQF
jgi:hypothetical protein